MPYVMGLVNKEELDEIIDNGYAVFVDDTSQPDKTLYWIRVFVDGNVGDYLIIDGKCKLCEVKNATV